MVIPARGLEDDNVALTPIPQRLGVFQILYVSFVIDIREIGEHLINNLAPRPMWLAPCGWPHAGTAGAVPADSLNSGMGALKRGAFGPESSELGKPPIWKEYRPPLVAERGESGMGWGLMDERQGSHWRQARASCLAPANPQSIFHFLLIGETRRYVQSIL